MLLTSMMEIHWCRLESVTYGSLATAPEVTKEGYSFSGWYTYNNEFYDLSNTPVDDVDLYSRWSVNSYSIIYLDYDGSVYAEYTVEYGASTFHDIPDNPVKEYYDFSAWQGYIPDIMPANNITLKAVYSKRIGVIYVTIQITIVYEDGSEETITIEVPQDQVEDIIAQYGNGIVID